MSGIARLLLRCGRQVSGSDLKESLNIGQLRSEGAKIFLGHRGENVVGADIVVYSSAIKEDNPEVQFARVQGIPRIRRAQALAYLMRNKTVVTVAGSHGKTTTTSLASHLFLQAGLQPTVAIGGVLRNINANACFGEGDFFIAEADESDGSFLWYHPTYSLITNIDREHLDYYQTFENEVQGFREFLGNTLEDGCVIGCVDDPVVRRLLLEYPFKKVRFGMNKDADIYPVQVRVEGFCSEFDCYLRGSFIDHFILSLGGVHNISNALSVIALGLELGIDRDIIKKALRSYQGAQRRLEVKFRDDRYSIIDDYAHHPTEIKATLSAVKQLNASRVVAVFQPHRFTRTQLLFDEFAESFFDTDYLILTDIYPASEPPIVGVTAEKLYQRIRSKFPDKQIQYCAKEEVVALLLRIREPGDVIITLGAGDIVKICEELVEEFAR